MTPSFSAKNGGQRYRFYACINALKRGRQACPSRYLPALEIEKLVVEQIREIATNRQSSRKADEALAPFRDHSVWETLPAAEQARLVQHLVQRVEYDGREGKVAITFHSLDNQNSNGELTSKENDR
jgi:site-specific DNA recombinase